MNTTARRDSNGIVFRNPETRDGKRLWEIAKATRTLDLNSVYHYLILCRHFSKTCVVAENQGRMVGFVTAYIPPNNKDTVFVWQVAVDGKERGRGIGVRMLARVFENAAMQQVRNLAATITPSNRASVRLFTAAARGLNAPYTFEKEFFSAADFGQIPHEPERLFHIGPVAG